MPGDHIEDTGLLKRCPTCQASLKGSLTCRRCKTDLSTLAEISRHHRRHMDAARRALDDGDGEHLFLHARRAHNLRRTPASSRLLACAALLTGRFALAAGLWAEGKDSGDD